MNQQGLSEKLSDELGLVGNVDHGLVWKTGKRRPLGESVEREGVPQRRRSRREGSSVKADSNDHPLLSALQIPSR